MALIWSKMTTGLPFLIRSGRARQGFISNYVLDIDIHKWVYAVMGVLECAAGRVSLRCWSVQQRACVLLRCRL